ncbi:gluconate 2-dehydrogenase [Klebsiella pneumoniae]|nr:gluconate 2-dehydrogenase [Klebsiella pneumoniae]
MVIALVLGALSCAAFAEEAPADSNLIKQGEYLARAGDCVACHTNGKAGKPFAGGLPMETPIGTIYSTNITPDKEHGIGGYTFEEFDERGAQGRAERRFHALSGDAVSLVRADQRSGHARHVRLLYARRGAGECRQQGH